MEFLEKYGSFVLSIQFRDCSFDSVEDVLSILRLTTNVEKINCDYNFLKYDEAEIPIEEHHDFPEMKFLRSLQMEDHLSRFRDFFCLQNSLTELYLYSRTGNEMKDLFSLDYCGKIHFKLKKLAIGCSNLPLNLDLCHLLSTQAHLEELDLGKNNIKTPRKVFNELKFLVKLTIPGDCLSINPSLPVSQIKECSVPSLKELKVYSVNIEPVEFMELVRIFPNIVKLTIDCLMLFHMECLKDWLFLEDLTVYVLRMETLINVKFLKIKSLEVENLYPFGLSYLWENFSTNNPSLERLVIRKMYGFGLSQTTKDEISGVLSCLKNFRSLKYFELRHSYQEPTVHEDAEGFGEIVDINAEPLLFDIVVESYEHKPKILKVARYFAENCIADYEYLTNLYQDHEYIIV